MTIPTMKKSLRSCQWLPGAAVACLLFSTGISRGASEGAKLYEISTKDLCAQIFDDIKEREKDMISPRGSGPIGQTRSKTSDTKQNKGLNVLLLFDVSRSVVNKSAKSGTPMDKIKKEAVKLVDSLSSSTRFNIVQFTRNYIPFKENLVPTDAANRKEFRSWVGEKWNDSGKLSSVLDGAKKNPSGILGVLEFSKTMKPDVIYLISDGSFQQGKAADEDPVNWGDIRKAMSFTSSTGKKVPINFIAFAPEKADALQMKTIAEQSGGQFSVLAKKAP